MTSIIYKSSVFTPAGWRAVYISATAKHLTEKMLEVVQVTAIDGETPTGYTSITGAKRQTYHAAGVAQREIGKKKRVSALVKYK
jgi:hypothetical protein